MFNPYNTPTSFPTKNTAQPPSSSSSSSWRKGAGPSQRNDEAEDSITYLDIPKPVSSIMADNRRLNGTPMDAKYTRDEVKAAVRTRRENRKNEERLNQQRKEILTKMQADSGLTRYFFSVFPDGAPIPGITAVEDCVLGIRHSEGRKLDTEITEAEVSRALELFADQVKWHNASLTPVGTVSEECVKGSTADTLTMRLETQRLRRKLSETTEQSEGLALLARIDKLVEKRVRATVEKQKAALYPEASDSGIPKRATKWPESRFQHPKTRGWHMKSPTQERIEAWAAWERANERTEARIKRQNEKTAKQLEWELDQQHAATLKKVFTPTDEELKGLKRSLKPETDGLAKPKDNRGDGMKKIIEHLKAGSDSWSTDGNDGSEGQSTAQPLFYSPTKEILDTFKKAWNLPLIKSMFSEMSTPETDVKGKGKAVDRSEAEDEAAKRERNLQTFEARQRQMEDLVVDNDGREHFLSDVLHDQHWTGRSNPDSFLRGWPQRSNETMLAVLGRASELSEQEKQWERKQYWADSAAQMDVQLQRVKRQREEKPESETVASASKKTKTEAEAASNERVRKNFRAGFEKWKSENVKQVTLAEAYQHLFKGKDSNAEVDQTNTPDDKAVGKQKIGTPYVANPPMTYAPRRQVFPTSNVRNEDPEKGDAVSCNFWASPERQLLNAEGRDTSQEDLGSSAAGGLDEEPPSIRAAKQSAAAWMHQGPTPPAVASDGGSQSTKEAFHEMMKRNKRSEDALLQQIRTAEKALKDLEQGKIRSRGTCLGFHHPPPQSPYDTSSLREAAQTPTGPSSRPWKQNETEKAPEREKKNNQGNGAEMPCGDRPIWRPASAYPQPLQEHYPTPKRPLLYTLPPVFAASHDSYDIPPPTVSTEKARMSASPFPQPENRKEAKKTPDQEKNDHMSYPYNLRPCLDLKHPTPYRPNYTSPYAPNCTGPSTPYYANWMNYASPSTLNYAAVPAFSSATPPTRPSYPTPYTSNHPLRHTACYDVPTPPSVPPPAPVRTETTRATAQPPRPAPKPPVDFELAYNTLAAKFQNLHISTAATVRALNEDLKRASTSVDRMIQKMAEVEASSSEAPQTSSATRPLYPDMDVPEEAADSVAEVGDEVEQCAQENEPVRHSFYYEPYVEDDEDSIVMENEPVMEEPEQDETEQDETEQDETEQDEPEQEQCPCPECQCANASWSRIGGYDDEACDDEDMVCDCAESDDLLLDSCYCATCELLRESGAEVPEEVAVSGASSETEGETAEVEIDDEDYCILDDEDRDAEQDDEYEWVGEDEFA
ncbi:hypothetical protein RB213_007820 [Colletotrichum asianum]